MATRNPLSTAAGEPAAIPPVRGPVASGSVRYKAPFPANRYSVNVSTASRRIRLLDVLYPWEPRASDELSIAPGDVLEGLQKVEEWWLVRNPQGDVGVVPGNYVCARGQGGCRAQGAASAGAATASRAGRAQQLAGAAPKKQQGKPARPIDLGTLKLGIWAHWLTYYGALTAFLVSIANVRWSQADSTRATDVASRNLGTYGIPMSIFVGLVEFFTAFRVPLFRGEYRTCAGLPWRGVFWILLSVPLWARFASITGGFALALAGVVAILSVLRGEKSAGRETLMNAPRWLQRGWEGRNDDKDGNDDDEETPSWCAMMRDWCVRQRESGETGKWVMLILYVAANVGYGGYLLVDWLDRIDGNREDHDRCIAEQGASSSECSLVGVISRWGAIAKMCGGLLNLNCSLLLLPVLRSLLRTLNNIRCGRTGSLATYVPLRKNVTFHKLVGKMVGVLTLGHVIGHVFNFAIAPEASVQTFPAEGSDEPWYGSVRFAPFYTGAAIAVAMLFIYSSVGRTLRAASYELFFYNHHFFILFYVALIFHGPVFIYWAGVPIFFYIVERIARVRRGRDGMFLRTVRWIDPVLALEILPEDKNKFLKKYQEGQYVYLNCPYLSSSEWHPFTVSSAAGDLKQRDMITLHIRVHPGGWTDRLKEFLNSMNPQKEYPFHLSHRDEHGAVVWGKDRGPDGRQLLKLDGPHAAPAQHYAAYRSCLLVGAGIGLTPAAAIIRAILLYKWKKGYHPDQIYFAWVVRQSELAAFQWFIALLAEMMAERSRDIAAGNVNPQNLLEMHIFVTRVDRGKDPPALLESAELPEQLQAHASVTPHSLLQEAFMPSATTRDFSRVMAQSDLGVSESRAPNRLGDIFCWDGRPPWKEVFPRIRASAVEQHIREIGVTFCGAAVIGKDLKENCTEHSDVREKIMFRMHKETF